MHENLRAYANGRKRKLKLRVALLSKISRQAFVLEHMGQKQITQALSST